MKDITVETSDPVTTSTATASGDKDRNNQIGGSSNGGSGGSAMIPSDDRIISSDTNVSNNSSSYPRKSSFLSRSKRKEAKQQSEQGEKALQARDSVKETFVHHPSKNQKDNNNNNKKETFFSPTSSVQTTQSGANKRRRRRTSSIKFLKRALSSPPILLQRLHSSRNNSCNGNNTNIDIDININSKDSFCKDTSEDSCRDVDGAEVADIIQQGSSSSSVDVGLNPPTNNNVSLPSNRSAIYHRQRNNSNNNNNNKNLNNMTEQTKVVSESYSPSTMKNNYQHQQSELLSGDEQKLNEEININKINCATSILHHSYLLESICGVPNIMNNNDDKTIFEKSNNRLLSVGAADHNNNDLRHQHQYHDQYHDRPISISEDPTIQESIECIFASELEDGLKLWDDDEDGDDNNNIDNYSSTNNRSEKSSFDMLEQVSERQQKTVDDLLSPADLQQSRMNRKDRRDSTKSIFSNMSQTKKRYEQASLVYVGTFDPSCPTTNTDEGNAVDGSNGDRPSDPLPCRCSTNFLPAIEPKNWPQAPIALRPTPGSNTRVKCIRFSNSDEPLWVPGSHLTWSQRLAQHWGKFGDDEQQQQLPHYACCEKCVILPINNGNEKPGESLVVDFESDLFEGSLLLRLRYAEGTTPEPYDDNIGYFKGVNRRYQACIRGRFKKSTPFTELVTGLRFDRRFGKLPPKWILKGALKVISFFAPQLDTKVDVDRPTSLSPLGSTPQCIIMDDDCSSSSNNNTANGIASEKSSTMNPLDDVRIEPSEANRNILGTNFKGETSLQRAKMRKKTFDKLYVQKAADPKTNTTKIYTFEFLQHLFNFQEFSIELGNMLGSLNLEDMLNGQPLQIMAAHGDQPLWSFDVWHECLWEQAKFHDDQQQHSNK